MPAAPAYLPVSYDAAVSRLGGREVRKIGNNTTVERLGASLVGIRYHATIIATFNSSGNVNLSSGGYRTATTKARLDYIASAYGFNISQKNYSWILRDRLTGTETAWEDGTDVAAPLATRRSA